MNLNTIPQGTVQLKVTCVDIPGLLSKLNAMNIPLMDVNQVNELTVCFCLPRNCCKKALQIIERFGGNVSEQRSSSGILLWRTFIRRPILIFGALLILVMIYYLPTRIFFIQVSGNEQIPQREIMDVASDCGIFFGALRRDIRSEKVKNYLLSEIPELKWVGINTNGCVAKISVREKTTAELKSEQPLVSSLVAGRDGVITELTVTNGNAVCRVGQAVKKGDLLVSGYSDCGRCIYGTRAEAEIYAQTCHNFNVSTMTNPLQRGASVGSDKKFGLIIGKKRIKFYKGSGISDSRCVRMYREYPLTLPGGFQLPIVLTVQENIEYHTSAASPDLKSVEQVLTQYAHTYLESQMIAGMVEKEDYQIMEETEVLHLAGRYICHEMIGQMRSEEIIKHYEQTN